LLACLAVAVLLGLGYGSNQPTKDKQTNKQTNKQQ
jgi:hypothetical protein